MSSPHDRAPLDPVWRSREGQGDGRGEGGHQPIRSEDSRRVSLMREHQPISVEDVPLLSCALPSASLALGQVPCAGELVWFAEETMISPLIHSSEAKSVNETTWVSETLGFLNSRRPDMLSCEGNRLISN